MSGSFCKHFALCLQEPNICQVKLDFLVFDSTSANVEGDCDTDRLRITNSITLNNDFSTCGNLAGQHMYLTFGNRDTIEVSPILKSATSRYQVVATMIPCTSRNRAPDHCLQYFSTPNGIVKSFDFGVQQQNSQKYTICVKPDERSSSVKWTPCNSGITGNPFNIVTNVQVEPHDCSTDWVQVNGLPKVCEPFVEMNSAWKPYNLLVNFDAQEFPPPPPSFNKPVNPANCAAECVDSPGVTCSCMPEDSQTAQQCMCVIENLGNIQPDFNNAGFCLEYSQL